MVENDGMIMPVTPMNNGGGMFGNGFGGDGWWILLLFILLGGNGMWGNNGNCGTNGLYPWMNQSNQMNDGFRDQMINGNITEIRNGVTGLSTQLCNGIGDIQMGMATGFANVEQGANARQIANMQQAFAAQAATTQGFNGVNSSVADLKYNLATEACSNRTAVSEALQNITMQNMGNTNAIVGAITGGIQSIKDQLCEYRNAQKDETIANLRQELLYSRGQASQVEQTAQLLANNNAQTALFQQGLVNEVDALYNRLNNCPISTVPVYGKQPIFTCPNSACGN